MEKSSQTINHILICSLTPYFLEKGNIWIEENSDKILTARKTQSFFEDNVLFLEKNSQANLSQVLRKLDEMGYEKVLKTDEPGEFSQQGGLLDVFPINTNQAVRIDFLGNKIDNLEMLPGKEIDEKTVREILKKRLKSQKIFSDLKGLKPGDYLVHLDHGIGRFTGLEKYQATDYYILEYAANDKLYVPLGLERKLSRYIGFSEPKINRLGSLVWQKTKGKMREDTEKLAKELLNIYADRERATRPPYSQDDEIDSQLAADFSYQETPDQKQALQDIENDLQKTKPMDRIVCGDVGFGKTEIALRTMVKAVKNNYQAAMICPTTILANQHFLNFKERLKNLPIKTVILSRLQSPTEESKTLNEIKQGQADIIIGTHRLLSNDVEFKNLGLLVIDDEQKFGVKQKEKLRKMRSAIDVLSLSATPIPRTLYLALSSLKSVSLVQTPPTGRLPVKTSILPFSAKIIKKAIEQEVARNGQVYYLHNRVETIGAVKNFLEKLLPKVKFSLAHGRLKEKELIKIMNNFQDKKADVLIATTIIENGIDLPNANTLIVADAGRLGLSQAYQIRGRVGRSSQQSFAYFLHNRHLTEKAKLRLEALEKTVELGSGYKIALRDLEIRGAGNVLGKEQSGNINRVGLNLYCQMLSEAVEKLKIND
jgi:transcription-repair coupling factor (superfamily II helicase)